MDYCSFIWLCSNGWIINIAAYRFPVRSYESDILISFPDCHSAQRCHLPARDPGRAERCAHTHININRQVDKHTHSQREGERGWVGVGGECVLSPSSAQALQSPFEDFKNHLGLLSIFVKQLNQKAAAHEIQRGRRRSSVESMRGRRGQRQEDVP